jgi:hypothetical protein
MDWNSADLGIWLDSWLDGVGKARNGSPEVSDLREKRAMEGCVDSPIACPPSLTGSRRLGEEVQGLGWPGSFRALWIISATFTPSYWTFDLLNFER